MDNRLLTSHNCLITALILDHLGLLRRIILRLVTPTLNRMVNRFFFFFFIAGLKLWNDIPKEVRQSANVNAFKRALKTHLFKEAYELD